MAKQDYIPAGIQPFMVWHDQFKTAVLANAATFGLVAGDTTPITNDNTDIHAKVTNMVTTGNIAIQAVADKNTSRANANKHARALAKEEGTGANRGNGGRNQNLCSLRSLPFKSGPGGVVQPDFDTSISDGVNMNPEGFRGCSSPPNPNCANTKPSMSKATPRLACSATRCGELRAVIRRDDPEHFPAFCVTLHKNSV